MKQIVGILLYLQRLTLKPSALRCVCGTILNHGFSEILYFAQLNISDIVIKASEQHTCYWRSVGHMCLPDLPCYLPKSAWCPLPIT